jgi:hypothetical protein
MYLRSQTNLLLRSESILSELTSAIYLYTCLSISLLTTKDAQHSWDLYSFDFFSFLLFPFLFFYFFVFFGYVGIERVDEDITILTIRPRAYPGAFSDDFF